METLSLNPRSRSRIRPVIQEVPAMSDNRQHAHQLIDRLPDSQLTALVGLLKTIVDPVTAARRDAPFDLDEPQKARRSLTRAGRRSLCQYCAQWIMSVG